MEEADDIKVLIIKGAGRALAAGAPLNEVGFVYGWKEPKHGEKAPKTPIRNRLKFDRKAFLRIRPENCSFSPRLPSSRRTASCSGHPWTCTSLCDFIVGAEDCKFGEIEVRLGIPR